MCVNKNTLLLFLSKEGNVPFHNALFIEVTHSGFVASFLTPRSLAVLLIYHLDAIQGYLIQTGKSTTKLEKEYISTSERNVKS